MAALIPTPKPTATEGVMIFCAGNTRERAVMASSLSCDEIAVNDVVERIDCHGNDHGKCHGKYQWQYFLFFHKCLIHVCISFRN